MSLTAQSAAPVLRGTLMVKNLMPNATVFSKSINGTMLKIDFAAEGYPGDTERVPAHLAEDIDFIKSLENGILEVVGGPDDIVEALKFETQQVRADRERQSEQYTDVLDRRQERDIVGATCIGPGPVGRSADCGRALLMSASESSNTPPLCEQHKPLVNEFFLAEAGSKGEGATPDRDGVVRREWRRAEMVKTRTL